MKTLLVTGTDTGVGKTWITCLLVREMRRLQLRTGAYKPVCSGAETDASGNIFWSDVEFLRDACGDSPPVDLVCPQRYQAASAPNVAAAQEQRHVDNLLLLQGIEAWRPLVDYLIIEGAGGIFCPLSDSTTVLDLAAQLKTAVIVVAANRLGVINHTRLTVEATQTFGLSVVAIVLNEVTPPELSVADASLMTNAMQLQKWIPTVPIFRCAFQAHSVTALRSEKEFVQQVLE